MLQVRAKAPSSEKQTSLSFPVHETEGVRSLYEEIRDKVVSMRLVAAGVSIAAAFLVAFSDVDPASARYSNPLSLGHQVTCLIMTFVKGALKIWGPIC